MPYGCTRMATVGVKGLIRHTIKQYNTTIGHQFKSLRERIVDWCSFFTRHSTWTGRPTPGW